MNTPTKTQKKKLWTCPQCGRKFERHGQSHSCRFFPKARHFEGKPFGKILFNKLKQALQRELGPFTIESLECCIHFVSTFTFAAAKIFRKKIRVDFSLSRKLKSDRITKSSPMSAHRYLYCIDVMKEEEIDAGLLELIQEARDK